MLLRHVASVLIWHDASGALPSLTELKLYKNQICNAGMSALADALSKGALDHLTVC